MVDILCEVCDRFVFMKDMLMATRFASLAGTLCEPNSNFLIYYYLRHHNIFPSL